MSAASVQVSSTISMVSPVSENCFHRAIFESMAPIK
jgi:hypothetical protein